jgi:hypothetical protein
MNAEANAAKISQSLARYGTAEGWSLWIVTTTARENENDNPAVTAAQMKMKGRLEENWIAECYVAAPSSSS